jgi:subtilisin family serine protease
MAFVIGATGADGKVTDFSSRGPAVYHGQITQKPDVTAPGDNVRSSVPGGGYEEMSGTSMATPHAAGTTALLFQINPAFTPDQVRKILQSSTKPMNPDGTPAAQRGTWNANYGLGKMDAYAAVQLAKTVRHALEVKGVELPFLLSPEDVTVQDILTETAVPVDAIIHFPGEWQDPSAWASPEEVLIQ